MVRPALLCVVVVLAVCGGVGTATAAETTSNATPTVQAVYPNPVAADDAGEFVLVEVPAGADLGALSVADGDGVARPVEEAASGVVALSTAPNRTRELTDHRVVELEGTVAFGNAGDRVVLRYRGHPVAVLSYDRAPEGEVYGGTAWRPLGATDLPATVVENPRVTTFALPDTPSVPAELLASAERRLLLGGYTFRSERARDLLVAAASRGVTVRVLVEGGPAGGIDRRQAELLDELAANGVAVRVVDGPRARYRFHHPKYVVVDDSVLVTSENWGPGGTGGRATRGWGAVVESRRLADRLAAVFRADAGWADTTTWRRFRSGAPVQPATPPPTERYPKRFPARTRTAESVRLVVAPDNAGQTVRELIADADQRLLVAQPRVDPDHGFVRAVVVRGDPARYYARVFRADWRGGAWRLPAGVLVLVTGAVGVVCVGLWRAVTFAGERRPRVRRRGPPPPTGR